MDKKVIGIILLVAGGALIFWGYQSSQALGAQLQRVVEGAPSTRTMVLYVLGGVLAALGAYRLVK